MTTLNNVSLNTMKARIDNQLVTLQLTLSPLKKPRKGQTPFLVELPQTKQKLRVMRVGFNLMVSHNKKLYNLFK